MARGDQKSYRGRGGGGGGSYYDDEGRGASKTVWEWFEENFEAASDKRAWLMSIDDYNCHKLISWSTTRYGLDDIALYSFPKADTRARRLVEKVLDAQVWLDFHAYMKAGYDRHNEERRRQDSENNARWNEERAARIAEAARVRLEETNQIRKDIELTAGALRSDFSEVIVRRERYGSDDGDYIEDVTDAYHSGHGFADEVRQQGGIKMQVTLSLDCSNSMRYNGVSDYAKAAFFNMGLALKALAEEFPTSLFPGFFLFSMQEDGKGVRHLTAPTHIPDVEDHLGEFESFRETTDRYWGLFNGEDTWIDPLFKRIALWEKANDEGAARLDIILTDAVLEHVTDIREADKTQELRDGNLQTILLNFMPEEEWLGSTMPRRCVQYHADKDNIQGLLRNVLTQFVGAYL